MASEIAVMPAVVKANPRNPVLTSGCARGKRVAKRPKATASKPVKLLDRARGWVATYLLRGRVIVLAAGASQYPGGFQSLGPCPMSPHVNSPKRPSMQAHFFLPFGRLVRQTPERA